MVLIGIYVSLRAEDGYGRQPDTGTTQLAAAIDGTGGPNGNETFDLFVPST